MRKDIKLKARLAWGLLLLDLALAAVCLAMAFYAEDIEALRCAGKDDHFREFFWGSILVLPVIGLPFAFAAVTVRQQPGVWPWFSLGVALFCAAPSMASVILGLLSMAACTS